MRKNSFYKVNFSVQFLRTFDLSLGFLIEIRWFRPQFITL